MGNDMGTHKIRIIAIIAVAILSMLLSIKAEASWLMLICDDEVENITCVEGLRLVSITLGEKECFSCIPKNTGMDSMPVDTEPPVENQNPPADEKHEGPYEGTPIGGPLFN